MQQHWVRYYRPIEQRPQVVQDTATTILLLLADAPYRLTALQIGRQTRYLETKSRSYLGLLDAEHLVDKVKGTAGQHGCKRKICKCIGWGITTEGREYLRQR